MVPKTKDPGPEMIPITHAIEPGELVPAIAAVRAASDRVHSTRHRKGTGEVGRIMAPKRVAEEAPQLAAARSTASP
jgi:hypothetical protein